jgi:hypothetical protein
LELDRLNGSSREQLIEYLAESAGRVRTLEEKLRGAELENRYLRELLRLARIEKYGPGSEKLSDEQLALLELEPGVSQAEVEAEAGDINIGSFSDETLGVNPIPLLPPVITAILSVNFAMMFDPSAAIYF